MPRLGTRQTEEPVSQNRKTPRNTKGEQRHRGAKKRREGLLVWENTQEKGESGRGVHS